MPQYLSPIGNDQFIDANGDPLSGGQIETYLAGSSTPAATYTSSSGATPQSNPVILNSLGYPTLGPIWLTGGVSYKFIIKDASGSTLRTIDDIAGVNDASVSQSEWVESGFVPTYIGATSFSVPGDQTPILQIGRRTRTTNTSGFIYSSITNSVFAAGITTVTLANDSGSLDAGLSLVAYGLPSVTNSSLPVASTTVRGIVELATDAEAQAGLDTARALTAANMKAAQIQLGTAVTLTTQTSVDFTGIPSWAKRITVMFTGVSTNGTSPPILQFGDSGGIETTGYLGSAGVVGASTAASSLFTNGIGLINAAAATVVMQGAVTLSLMTGTTWVASGVLTRSDSAGANLVGGSKATSAALDRIRLTTSGGTDQFDAGSVNISWE